MVIQNNSLKRKKIFLMWWRKEDINSGGVSLLKNVFRGSKRVKRGRFPLWSLDLDLFASRANVSDRFILNYYSLLLNLIIHQVLDIERKRNLSNENELLAHANNRIFFLSQNNKRKSFIIISLHTTYVPRSPLADGSACLTLLIDELA